MVDGSLSNRPRQASVMSETFLWVFQDVSKLCRFNQLSIDVDHNLHTANMFSSSVAEGRTVSLFNIRVTLSKQVKNVKHRWIDRVELD